MYTSEFPASAQINSKYSRSSLPHLPTCTSNGRTPARPSSLTGGAPATRRLSSTPTAGRTLGWASPPSTAPTRARCLAWQGACPSLCLCLPVCLSWMTGRACLSSARRLGVASACTSSWPSTAVTLRGIVLIKLETDPFFAVYRPAAEGRSAPAESPDPNDFTVQYKDADGDLADMTPSSDIKYVDDWCRPRRTLLPAWSFLKLKDEPAVIPWTSDQNFVAKHIYLGDIRDTICECLTSTLTHLFKVPQAAYCTKTLIPVDLRKLSH